jgi:hypothetical protein
MLERVKRTEFQSSPLPKTLPDGAHKKQTRVVGHLFRDSQGRTRVEKLLKAAPIWTTEIFDPVEGLAYILEDEKKIAHRMVMQPPLPQPVATRVPWYPRPRLKNWAHGRSKESAPRERERQ